MQFVARCWCKRKGEREKGFDGLVTLIMRTSWYRFPIWNAEVHGAIIPGRLTLRLSSLLASTERLVLRWAFIFNRVPRDFHHTARASSRGRRRGARLGLWWCGRKHVKGLRGRTVIASTGRRGSLCRGPVLRVLTLGCGLGISSRFHWGGLWWVILAAGPIHWAKMICHCILVARRSIRIWVA